LQNLRRWMLVTAVAQNYEQFGFQVATQSERYAKTHRPEIYQEKRP
jgi:hypothetical protein